MILETFFLKPNKQNIPAVAMDDGQHMRYSPNYS